MTVRKRRPGAGRPRLDRTPEERLSQVREWSRATSDRQRLGRVQRTLFLTPAQAERLQRAQANGEVRNVNELIEAIIRHAPEPEPQEDTPCPRP